MEQILEIIAKTIKEKRAYIEILEKDKTESLNQALAIQTRLNQENDELKKLELEYVEIDRRYGGHEDTYMVSSGKSKNCKTQVYTNR